jgi:hypothetical protein
MGLLASLLGGVIGGAAEPVAAGLGAMKPLFEDAAEEARWHARAYLSGPPGNHDLERALHAAAVTGVLAVLRGHEMSALGERAPRPGSLRDRYRRLLTGLETVLELGVPDPAALEVWHTRDWCHKELGRLRELEEEDHQRVLATLDAALVPGFAAPGAPRGDVPPDARIGAAEDASSNGCGRDSRNAACGCRKSSRRASAAATRRRPAGSAASWPMCRTR